MEKMPYRSGLDMPLPIQAATASGSIAVVSTDWRQALPVLANKEVVLRELRASAATRHIPVVMLTTVRPIDVFSG